LRLWKSNNIRLTLSLHFCKCATQLASPPWELHWRIGHCSMIILNA
jgi:hypothetical protein